MGGRADIKPRPCVAARFVIMFFALEASKSVALPEPKQVNVSCTKRARVSVAPSRKACCVHRAINHKPSSASPALTLVGLKVPTYSPSPRTSFTTFKHITR